MSFEIALPHWRVIRHGKLPGKANMAFDAAQLTKATERGFIPVLRFYDWRRPTITVGYGQKRDDIDFAKLDADGIDFAVRPTGGRAVLHWDEVTYSITLPAGNEICDMSVIESYRVLSEGLATGFLKLGIDAKLSKGEAGGHKNPSCFSSTSRYEVVVNGRKLIGSAQRRKRGALLQQGSIPVGPEFRRLTDYLCAPPISTGLPEKATCVEECLDATPSKSEIIDALIAGLRESIKFIPVETELEQPYSADSEN